MRTSLLLAMLLLSVSFCSAQQYMVVLPVKTVSSEQADEIIAQQQMIALQLAAMAKQQKKDAEAEAFRRNVQEFKDNRAEREAEEDKAVKVRKKLEELYSSIP